MKAYLSSPGPKLTGNGDGGVGGEEEAEATLLLMGLWISWHVRRPPATTPFASKMRMWCMSSLYLDVRERNEERGPGL